jgi:hypothetical protein
MPPKKPSKKVNPFAQTWASGDDPQPDKETRTKKDAPSTPEDLRGDKNPFASPDSGPIMGSTTSVNTTTSADTVTSTDTSRGSSDGGGSTVEEDGRSIGDDGAGRSVDEEGSDGEMTDSTWGTLTSKSPVYGRSRSSSKLDDVLDHASPTTSPTASPTIAGSTTSSTTSPAASLSPGSSVGSVDALRTAANPDNKTSLGIPVVVAARPTADNNRPFVMTSPAMSLLGESPQSSGGNHAPTDEPQSGIQIIMASPQPTPPQSPIYSQQDNPQQHEDEFPTELVSLLQNFAHMGKTPNEDLDEPSPVVDSSKYLSGDAARVLGEMLLASGTAIVRPVSEAKNGHSITTEDVIKKWAEYSIKGCNQQPCLDYSTNAVKNLREAQQREGVQSSNTYENLELPSKMMFPVRKVTTSIKQRCGGGGVRLRPTAAVALVALLEKIGLEVIREALALERPRGGDKEFQQNHVNGNITVDVDDVLRSVYLCKTHGRITMDLGKMFVRHSPMVSPK